MKHGLSDHYLVFASRRNSAFKRNSNRVCLELNDYFGFTEHNLNEVFKGDYFLTALCERAVDDMLSRFGHIYNSLVRILVTVNKKRFVKSSSMPVWLDDEVRHHMKLRDGLKHDGNYHQNI